MKVLSIGNSFSQDAQRYLSRVSNGEIYSVNLCIGGCTLRKHYENMLTGEALYDLQICGEDTDEKISLTDGIKLQEWDVITLQQASHESFDINTYTPYIEGLAELLRKECPKAKILIHRTWGYEEGSEKLASMSYNSFEDMNEDIKKAYNEASQFINADGIIPSGDTVLNLFKMGLKPHRDGFHIDLGYGRYALALTWYGYLTGKDIQENSFRDFDVFVTEGEIEAVKTAVKTALEANV